MRLKLASKILLSLTLITFCFVLCFATFQTFKLEKKLYAEAVDMHRARVRNILPALASGLFIYNDSTVSTLIQSLFINSSVVDVNLFDEQKKPYSSLIRAERPVIEASEKESISLYEPSQPRHFGEVFSEPSYKVVEGVATPRDWQLQTVKLSEHRYRVTSLVPSPTEREGRYPVLGFISVDFSTAYVRREAALARYQTFAWLLGLGVILLALIFILVRWLVVSPVAKLADATKEAAKGRFHPVPLGKGEDEIEQLKRTYNTMISKLNENMNQRVRTERISVSTQLVQMMAHDIRKPNSLYKMLLEGIRLSNSKEDALGLIESFEKDLARAIASIESIVSGVLEIGTDRELSLCSMSSSEVVHIALESVFRKASQEVDVNFEYEFNNTKKLQVDLNQILRVLTNILDNSVQAMKGKGTITIRTRDCFEQGERVEIVIANNGPPISQADLSKVFDEFYTRGKRGGTGLGLAIAKQVVMRHGGKIWCESGESGVSFHFTLQASQQKENHAHVIQCQPHSRFLRTQEVSHAKDDGPAQTELYESKLEKGLMPELSGLEKPLSIALVDDDTGYCEAVKGYVSCSEVLSQHTRIECFAGSSQFLEWLKSETPDLAIIDVDLGEQSLNGFELAKYISELNKCIFLCVHSNRSMPSDYENALRYGQAFLPKPMSRAHFLGLIEKSLWFARSWPGENKKLKRAPFTLVQ